MAIKNKVSLLDIDFPMPADEIPEATLLALVERGWQKVKGPVQALARAGDLKLKAFDPANAASDMREVKGIRGCEFFASIGEFNVGAYWTDGKRSIRVLAEGKVPLDTEELRAFLGDVNGWSQGGKKLVTDADVKKFEDDFPKKPKVYKTFEEMWKKDNNATAAFRSWTNRKGGKARDAYTAVLDTKDMKDKDPERVKALKEINTVLKDYYKSF